jgi:hypothetical protein
MKQFLLTLVLLLPGVVLAENAEPQDPALAEMEALASRSIQEALNIVRQSGGFYPFAMTINKTDSVTLVGYRGDPDARPPADDFAAGLFLQMRETVNRDKSVRAVVVLKPFHAEAADGSPVPGVWAAVDHRDQLPWVMFQPLILQENGRYKLGDIIYQRSAEHIFPPPLPRR